MNASVLASEFIDQYSPLKADSTFDTWPLGAQSKKMIHNERLVLSAFYCLNRQASYVTIAE